MDRDLSGAEQWPFIFAGKYQQMAEKAVQLLYFRLKLAVMHAPVAT